MRRRLHRSARVLRRRRHRCSECAVYRLSTRDSTSARDLLRSGRRETQIGRRGARKFRCHGFLKCAARDCRRPYLLPPPGATLGFDRKPPYAPPPPAPKDGSKYLSADIAGDMAGLRAHLLYGIDPLAAVPLATSARPRPCTKPVGRRFSPRSTPKGRRCVSPCLDASARRLEERGARPVMSKFATLRLRRR
jgi:hypothetical protein